MPKQSPIAPTTTIPNAPVTPSTTSGPTASQLTKSKRSPQLQQATVAATGAMLPVIYGSVRLGAKVAVCGVFQGSLVLLCVWGEGPISSITNVQLNDVAVPSGVSLTHYLGTATQTRDVTVAAMLASMGHSYNDSLPNIAYSVVVVPTSKNSGFPRVTAQVNGLLVATSSGGTPVYSSNPAYCLADFITNTRYGIGAQVNWTDVATTAAACDAMIGSPAEKTAILGLAVAQPQTPEAWISTLRDYARCYVWPDQGVFRMVPDAPSTSVMSFTASDMVQDSLTYTKRGVSGTPNVVQTIYTDTTVTPWQNSDPVEAAVPGITTRIVSRLQKPGTQRYSEAMRYSIERLNEATLDDISGSFVAFDKAAALQPFDIIDLTHPWAGWVSKLFRVVSIGPGQAGGGGKSATYWKISFVEYDPSKYSTSVVTGPSTIDTSLPDPTIVPTCTGLTVTEDVYQVQTGRFASRLLISWNADVFPYLTSYVVTVMQGTAVTETAVVSQATTSYTTGPLAENLLYTVSVYEVSSTGSQGAPAIATCLTNGKNAIPTDVPVINGYEQAGAVFLDWAPATDLDLTATELRFGATTGSWATATVLDRVAMPAIRYQTNVVPAGTWRIYAKGLDSVRTASFPNGQESLNAAYVDVNVSINPNSYQLNPYFFTTPTLTMMDVVPRGWITDYGATWGSLFPSALSTYTGALGSYYGTGTSTLVTEYTNFGQLYSGLIVSNVSYLDLSGTAAVYIETSPDAITWTQWSGQSAQVSCQYARVRITTSGVMLVTDLGSIYMRVNTKSEDGSFTTVNTGPITITLANRYSALKTLQLTADGTSGQRNPVYQNVQLASVPRYMDVGYTTEDYVNESYSPNSSFQVTCYDGSNNLVAATGRWLFTGI